MQSFIGARASTSLWQSVQRRAGWIGLGLAFLLVWIGLGFSQAQAAVESGGGERLLTVHDRGQERVFLTSANTVGEALDRAGIEVNQVDTVEPGVDEELVASDYQVNIYRARPVIVVDGVNRQRVMTSHQTHEQIAKAAGLQLYPEDDTSMGLPADLLGAGGGVELVIDRATPIELILYGKPTSIRTQAATVGDMLREKNIELTDRDKLSVSQGDSIKSGMVIELWRDGKQTITEEEDVSFEVEKIQDADREIGYREVKTPGEKGRRTVTYEIVMKNGKEVSRKEIASVTTKQPKKQVEVVGAKPANTFSGEFGDALARLRQCEAGGNYANKNNPTYRGAYQFGYGTWAGYGGYDDPADAPPAIQDQAAAELYKRRGWQPWPACSQSLGLQDIYR